MAARTPPCHVRKSPAPHHPPVTLPPALLGGSVPPPSKGEPASRYTSVADGEALVQSATIKVAAAISRQSVSSGHYMAALLRLINASAAAGSLGPGGLGVALAYTTDLSLISGETSYGTMVEYDTRQRREAAAQEWKGTGAACKLNQIPGPTELHPPPIAGV